VTATQDVVEDGTDEWQPYRVIRSLRRLGRACEIAVAIADDGSFARIHSALFSEALAVVVDEARTLTKLTEPASAVSTDVPTVPRQDRGLRQVGLRQPIEGDRDATPDDDPQVLVGAVELDGQRLWSRGEERLLHLTEARSVADLEGLPGVVHAHDESSSAVGAPGAENTERLASTVGAPADTSPSSAGSVVGGPRPWRGLFPRLRGRPSP
jgi:hypothetical protein